MTTPRTTAGRALDSPENHTSSCWLNSHKRVMEPCDCGWTESITAVEHEAALDLVRDHGGSYQFVRRDGVGIEVGSRRNEAEAADDLVAALRALVERHDLELVGRTCTHRVFVQARALLREVSPEEEPFPEYDTETGPTTQQVADSRFLEHER